MFAVSVGNRVCIVVHRRLRRGRIIFITGFLFCRKSKNMQEGSLSRFPFQPTTIGRGTYRESPLHCNGTHCIALLCFTWSRCSICSVFGLVTLPEKWHHAEHLTPDIYLLNPFSYTSRRVSLCHACVQVWRKNSVLTIDLHTGYAFVSTLYTYIEFIWVLCSSICPPNHNSWKMIFLFALLFNSMVLHSHTHRRMRTSGMSSRLCG